VVYFREEEPFRIEFTNTIAYVAQVTLFFYLFLTLSTLDAF
jgi:hypothetical protein